MELIYYPAPCHERRSANDGNTAVAASALSAKSTAAASAARATAVAAKSRDGGARCNLGLSRPRRLLSAGASPPVCLSFAGWLLRRLLSRASASRHLFIVNFVVRCAVAIVVDIVVRHAVAIVVDVVVRRAVAIVVVDVVVRRAVVTLLDVPWYLYRYLPTYFNPA